MRTDTVKLGDFIKLTTPDGTITLSQGKLNLTSENENLIDAKVTFEGDAAVWQRIQDQGLFGYSEEVAGPIFGGGFKPDQPLRFELGLVPDAVTLLSLMDDGPMGRGLAIFDAAPDSLLRNHSTYQLLTVTQQMGPVRVGMSTTYLGLRTEQSDEGAEA